MSRGSLLTPEQRARVRELGTPVALALGRLGLTPNGLTAIGLAISIVAALVAASGSWVAAGCLVLGGAIFDLFDGALARATGKAGPAGAFLDSVSDRAGEGLVFLGILAGALAIGEERAGLLAAGAMAAAFMVSYTRSRAEGLGLSTGSGIANVGLAPREIRIAILFVGLVAAGMMADPIPALEVSLGAIALLATITTVQRTLHSLRAGGR